MSFDQLAAVELQLLMRCCDAQSLLALARCSRFTLSAASNPFAWRFLSPPSVPFVFRASANPAPVNPAPFNPAPATDVMAQSRF